MPKALARPAALAYDLAFTPSQPLSPPARVLVFWHLLSLDAPTVAALWTWFIARCAGLRLPPASIGAMFLAVWILYAADRLLDAGNLPQGAAELEARHLFHSEHRRPFRIGILLASLALAPLLLLLQPAAMHLYLVLGAALFAWFVLIHVPPVRPGAPPRRLPKELAVGVFFAAATYVPTVAGRPALRLELLPAAVLFAALCSLNCLFIYSWEHAAPGARSTVTTHPTTRLALRHLRSVGVVITLAATVLCVAEPRRMALLLLATAASATLLLLLDGRRPGAPTLLRAAADLVLLTPLLALPWLR